MPEPAMLDYFYGDEAEQYTFYRIPKVLFTDPAYRRISSDAKILYGLMLDRMGLSVRNGWLDDCQRVFIYFTLEDALEYLCCGHTKAVSATSCSNWCLPTVRVYPHLTVKSRKKQKSCDNSRPVEPFPVRAVSI